uniref:hypothetical protein n=1 Tax=Streptomyces sp. rh79 TaxID=3028727 RepID=UPI003C7A09BD
MLRSPAVSLGPADVPLTSTDVPPVSRSLPVAPLVGSSRPVMAAGLTPPPVGTGPAAPAAVAAVSYTHL